jgi:hypothetical protein
LKKVHFLKKHFLPPVQKKIFPYRICRHTGLVQQPDKIVVRYAHTIYPYSLELALSEFPELSVLADDLEWLSAFAVEFRYPGEEALEEDAKHALAIMERALSLLKQKII